MEICESLLDASCNHIYVDIGAVYVEYKVEKEQIRTKMRLVCPKMNEIKWVVLTYCCKSNQVQSEKHTSVN